MATSGVVWDGAARLGPVSLGMTLDEIKVILPGVGSWGDDIGDGETPYFWNSESHGLSIQTLFGVTISITADRSLVYDQREVIGMCCDAAVALLGGEVGRSDLGDPISFISTGSGLELSIENDRILWVTLCASEAEIDSLCVHGVDGQVRSETARASRPTDMR